MSVLWSTFPASPGTNARISIPSASVPLAATPAQTSISGAATRVEWQSIARNEHHTWIDPERIAAARGAEVDRYYDTWPRWRAPAAAPAAPLVTTPAMACL